MFEMKNLLIRKVGGSMLLEAQKKKVKRQAFLGRDLLTVRELLQRWRDVRVDVNFKMLRLIERALNRDLPARMEDLEKKLKEPHIPWPLH